MQTSQNTNPRKPAESHHQNPLPNEISGTQKSLNESAHNEAEKDMDNDVELTAQSPNDDLDEGESARLGDDLQKSYKYLNQ